MARLPLGTTLHLCGVQIALVCCVSGSARLLILRLEGWARPELKFELYSLQAPNHPGLLQVVQN